MRNKALNHSINNKIYLQLEQKMDEVCIVAPQDLGFFTPLYKKITAPLKISPWKIILPLAFIFCFLAQLAIGQIMIKTASVLQSAF